MSLVLLSLKKNNFVKNRFAWLIFTFEPLAVLMTYPSFPKVVHVLFPLMSNGTSYCFQFVSAVIAFVLKTAVADKRYLCEYLI